MISNIYHSPTPVLGSTIAVHTNNFLETLDEHLSNLSLLNLKAFAFLDANINLINIDRNQYASMYLDIVHSNSFLQTINKATRIQGNSYSLIDHILINNVDTGVVLTEISDHFLAFVVSNVHKVKPLQTSEKTRDFSYNNLSNFRDYLGAHHWDDVTHCNEVNECLNKFLTHFNTGLDLYSPEESKTFNKNIDKKKQFYD